MMFTSAGGNIATAASPGGSAYGALRPSNQAKVLGSKTVGGLTYVNLDFSKSGGGSGWALASRSIVPVGGGSAYASAAKPAAKTAAAKPLSLAPTAAALNAQQQKETAGILSPYQQAGTEYEQALGNLQNPLDIYKQQETEAGIHERQVAVERLRKITDDTTLMLDRLEGDVEQRLSGALTTSAQRSRVVAAEGGVLGKTLETTGRELGREETALGEARTRAGTLTGLAVQGQEQTLRPLQAKLENLQVTMQTQLDALRDRLTRQYGAAEADIMMRSAEQQAATEFARQKQLMAKQQEYDVANARLSASLSSSGGGGGGGSTTTQTAAATKTAALKAVTAKFLNAFSVAGTAKYSKSTDLAASLRVANGSYKAWVAKYPQYSSDLARIFKQITGYAPGATPKKTGSTGGGGFTW